MAVAPADVGLDPPGSGSPRFPTRFDWLMSGMALTVAAGFFLDLWAHEHGRVDDSFFTPWHGVMYAGVVGFGLTLGAKAFPARVQGVRWASVLPRGYGLSLLGVVLFLIGGGLDLLWHTLLGIEQTVDALFSPSHLMLAGAGLLMLAGPMRRAWIVGASATFPNWIPFVLSAAATMAILTAFTQYAHPATSTWPAGIDATEFQRSDLVIMAIDGVRQTRISLGLADGSVTPAVSPDGRTIAFSAQAIDEDGFHGKLYLVNIDGTGARLLRDEPGSGGIYRPDWSPDGTQIAYNAQIDGNIDVFLIPVAGGEPTRLTTTESMEFAPDWSPDGQHIVFTSNAGGDFDLYTISAKGEAPRRVLDRPGDDFSPTWSPDGTRIVFQSDDDIYTVNADGTGLNQLTADPSADWEPRFSPDGESILFASNRDNQFDIYSMAVDGSDLTNISRHPGGDEGWGGIAWLPDGSGFVTNESGLLPGWFDPYFREAMGATALWLQAAILAVFLSLLMMTVGAPIGGVTVLLTISGVAMSVLSDAYWFVAAVAAASLIAEFVVYRLKPSPDNPRSIRVVAAVVPGLWYASYLLALGLQPDGLGWTIHMVAGAPLVAAGVGFLVGVLATTRPAQSVRSGA